MADQYSTPRLALTRRGSPARPPPAPRPVRLGRGPPHPPRNADGPVGAAVPGHAEPIAPAARGLTSITPPPRPRPPGTPGRRCPAAHPRPSVLSRPPRADRAGPAPATAPEPGPSDPPRLPPTLPRRESADAPSPEPQGRVAEAVEARGRRAAGVGPPAASDPPSTSVTHIPETITPASATPTAGKHGPSPPRHAPRPTPCTASSRNSPRPSDSGSSKHGPQLVLQLVSEPAVERHPEPHLRPRPDRRGQQFGERFLQHHLRPPAAQPQLPPDRHRQRQLDHAMIEERAAALQRMRHARLVDLREQVVRQIHEQIGHHRPRRRVALRRHAERRVQQATRDRPRRPRRAGRRTRRHRAPAATARRTSSSIAHSGPRAIRRSLPAASEPCASGSSPATMPGSPAPPGPPARPWPRRAVDRASRRRPPRDSDRIRRKARPPRRPSAPPSHASASPPTRTTSAAPSCRRTARRTASRGSGSCSRRRAARGTRDARCRGASPPSPRNPSRRTPDRRSRSRTSSPVAMRTSASTPTMIVESIPPDRNAPSGTSATICSRTASDSSSRSFATSSPVVASDLLVPIRLPVAFERQLPLARRRSGPAAACRRRRGSSSDAARIHTSNSDQWRPG